MRLTWESEAQREFSEAAVHYYFEEPGLEEEFIRQVEATAAKILDSPLQAREFDSPYRLMRTSRFPYALIYFVESETITIIALMHQSRNPGYWKHRD